MRHRGVTVLLRQDGGMGQTLMPGAAGVLFSVWRTACIAFAHIGLCGTLGNTIKACICRESASVRIA